MQGIGLSLTRELIRLHGGSIEVSSEAGRGSVFTVKLPIGKDHLPNEQVTESTSSAVRFLTDLRAKASSPHGPSGANGAKKEVSEKVDKQGNLQISPLSSSDGIYIFIYLLIT